MFPPIYKWLSLNPSHGVQSRHIWDRGGLMLSFWHWYSPSNVQDRSLLIHSYVSHATKLIAVRDCVGYAYCSLLNTEINSRNAVANVYGAFDNQCWWGSKQRHRTEFVAISTGRKLMKVWLHDTRLRFLECFRMFRKAHGQEAMIIKPCSLVLF